MTIVRTRTASLNVTEAGSGDPPLLFVHGWATDGTVWTPQFLDLARECRCVNVDLRGRGASPHQLPCDIETAADDLAAVVDALVLGPALVVGHDIGGLIALALNHRHPDAVAGIVTGDSPIGEAPRPASETGLLAAALRAAGSMEPARDLVARFFIDATPPQVSAHVSDLILSCPPDIAAGMLANEGLQGQWDELLKEADRKPFMAFWSENPLGDPGRLREIVVFLRQEPVAGAGHFFQLERPDITNALLRAFVDDVRRDPRVAAVGVPN